MKFIKKILLLFGIKITKLSKQKNNKIIKTNIGRFQLLINNQHKLPEYLKLYPYYSQNLPRIADKVFKKYNDTFLFDIGANIGDTVALVRLKTEIPIVCIEGSDFYMDLLNKNISQFNNVEVYKHFLGEKNATIMASNEIQNGTFKISQEGDFNSEISIISLDYFLKQNSKYKKAKILKIDTDGFDLKIIRGGVEFLKESTPVLFFEFDRYLLEKNNEKGLDIFNVLEEIGYSSILFYDNFGRFLLSTEISNIDLITQLYFYTYTPKSSFQYYDICVFHSLDSDIAKSIIETEATFFAKHENIL